MTKYIQVLKDPDNGNWHVSLAYTDDGDPLDTEFFQSEQEAIADAIKYIEFDEEANGKPERGVNYEVIPVQVIKI